MFKFSSYCQSICQGSFADLHVYQQDLNSVIPRPRQNLELPLFHTSVTLVHVEQNCIVMLSFPCWLGSQGPFKCFIVISGPHLWSTCFRLFVHFFPSWFVFLSHQLMSTRDLGKHKAETTILFPVLKLIFLLSQTRVELRVIKLPFIRGCTLTFYQRICERHSASYLLPYVHHPLYG